MVYTVTFNPALDYVLHMDHLQTGVLNRTQSEEIHCGGKGVNVSTVLKNLGVENVALGFLAGFTGQALESGLQKAGIRSDFIWLQTGMTRVNVKIKSGLETEINNPGPAIPPQALEGLFQKLDQLRPGDIIVLAGSIPDPIRRKSTGGSSPVWRAEACWRWWTLPGNFCGPCCRSIHS